jgi:hypothetical protein
VEFFQLREVLIIDVNVMTLLIFSFLEFSQFIFEED